MYIYQEECTGCRVCIPYCPVGAISEADGVASISFDDCVECTVCLRFASCPAEAICESPETAQWPRTIRRQFSDPMTPHSNSTGGRGRGTEEMKTNDVTGRVKRGEIGIGLEFGRPGVATRLADLEKMTVALARVGARFEPANPVTALLADQATGELWPELRNERVLSAIVEVQTPADRLPALIPAIQHVAEQVDTVISWEIITRLNDDGSVPIMAELESLGISVTVSGLIDEVIPLAQELGIKPHTVNLSMGILGKTDKLADEDVLEFTTMCGHALISANLVKKGIKDVACGIKTPSEASMMIGTPCVCGIYNLDRSDILLRERASQG